MVVFSVWHRTKKCNNIFHQFIRTHTHTHTIAYTCVREGRNMRCCKEFSRYWADERNRSRALMPASFPLCLTDGTRTSRRGRVGSEFGRVCFALFASVGYTGPMIRYWNNESSNALPHVARAWHNNGVLVALSGSPFALGDWNQYASH